MSPLKRFHLRLGWFTWRCFVFSLVLLLVAAVFFGISIISLAPGPGVGSFFLEYISAIRVISVCCFVVFFYLLVVSLDHANKENYLVAIYEARKFLKKEPDCGQRLIAIIDSVRFSSHDPTILNKWLRNYERLQECKKEIAKLLEQRNELPRLIEEKAQEIQDLGIELFLSP